MKISGRAQHIMFGFMLAALVLAVAAPAEAQRDFEPLFDKFNFKAELSWVGLSTTIGLYDEDFDQGGTLDFENDLNLGNRQSIPSLDFEWQIAKRHRLAARWQDISRDSTAQALTDIEWGDEIIPVDADIALGFETNQLYVDYTYYPWVKDRWALGFGLGLRFIDLTTTLAWRLDSGQVEEGSQDVDVAVPLPYLYGEYRRLLTDNWRMILGVGWLDVTIGDYSGGQWVGRAGFEYLLGKRWSVGGALNMATISAEAKNIDDDDGLGTLDLTVEMDIWDLSLFGRIRF
jgi:hypothetical protein